MKFEREMLRKINEMEKQKVPEKILDKYRKKFIGKKIIYFDKEKNKYVVGKLSFLGYNQYLTSWNVEAIIGNMPISNVEIDKIKFLPKHRELF